MLGKEEKGKIIDFVRQKPRTVNEIAALLDKNWRTADRYVETIAVESGLISTRTFREGTRGALKIVYWNALDRAKGSAYQERLFQNIVNSKAKEDFSPFDIYQFVPPDKRKAYLQNKEFSEHSELKYDDVLLSAKKQILFFSGNLSWAKLGPNMKKTLEKLARDKIDMKILTRIDVTSQKIAEEIMQINQRVGRDSIQLRHCEQPLRITIIDDELASVKEVLTPRIREVKKKTFLFYKITDHEWINWLQKIFWHLWGQSVEASARLEALKTIK